ncbi:hypothetical protein BDR07DRAFT_1523911 [Suillus spraguei]|nr:hypothetical protein BDR07DRAFT_1523911 [Suillus spraguei]
MNRTLDLRVRLGITQCARGTSMLWTRVWTRVQTVIIAPFIGKSFIYRALSCFCFLSLPTNHFCNSMSTLPNAPAGIRRAYPFRPHRVTEYSQPDTSFIHKDLLDKVAKFKQRTGTLGPVEITNVKPISSYSWIEAATPTIANPDNIGSPSVWFTGPKPVPADYGTRFVDQNSFYMRQMFPLIPYSQPPMIWPLVSTTSSSTLSRATTTFANFFTRPVVHRVRKTSASMSM